MKKNNKYASLPKSPAVPPAHLPGNLVLRFKRQDGRVQRLDLRFFNTGKYQRPQIAKVCAEIFLRYTQDVSSQTRKGLHNSLRVFNGFLDWKAEGDNAQPIHSTFEFSATLLVEYQIYLETILNHKENVASTYYNRFGRVLNLIRLYHPEYLSSDFRPPECRFKFTPYQPEAASANIISLSDLALIARAALKEVGEIREKHGRAIRMLAESDQHVGRDGAGKVPRGYWKEVSNALKYIVNERGVTGYSSPVKSSLRRNGHPSVMTLLGWYTPISTGHLIPFMVLLFIRTALNVTTLCRLKRDCMAEHPLPVGLTMVRFSKPRAGSRSSQEQNFPSNQTNGVVDLLKFLLEYTKPLVNLASDAEKSYLFLYRDGFREVRSGIAAIGFGNRSLRQFVDRNGLPPFNFNQLRPSVATALYLQTRDIFRVQRLLGHANVRTTVRYIKGMVVRAQHNKEMFEGIEKMTEAILEFEPREAGYQVFVQPVREVVAGKIRNRELSPEGGGRIIGGGCKTFLGRCKDPENSPQPGEVKGKVCSSLHACIFCPNCWIFAEDLPSVIRYRDSLLLERDNMTDSGWDKLYGDALREIDGSILTAFPAEDVRRAERKVREELNQNTSVER